MWKPNYVVQEDKKRATVVWNILLASILGIFVWKVVTVAKKYRNPTTSITVSDDAYQFPFMEVCLYNGCDEYTPIEDCIASVQHFILGPCGAELDVLLPAEDSISGCVTFKMEDLELEQIQSCADATKQRPTIDLWMYWEPTNGTVVDKARTLSVDVYLGGADVLQKTSVPYSRIERSEEESASEVRIGLTHMTIGKNTKNVLSGSSFTSYPTLTLSTTEYVSPSQTEYFANTTQSTSSSTSSTWATLYLTVELGPFSLTTLSEDNPINVPDFISSLGGLWEILLLGWGIFFIATQSTTPEQKARNFEEPIQRTKSMIHMPGSFHGSSRPAATSDAEGGVEEQPNWDIAHGGPVHATGGTNGGAASANESTV